jgi:hypothetical protein
MQFVEEITFDFNQNKLITTPVTVYPISNSLKMHDIWNSSYSSRMEHFLKSVLAEKMIKSSKETPKKENYFVIPDIYVVPCLVLRYLILSQQFLCTTDIDAFIITFVYLFMFNRKRFLVNFLFLYFKTVY